MTTKFITKFALELKQFLDDLEKHQKKFVSMDMDEMFDDPDYLSLQKRQADFEIDLMKIDGDFNHPALPALNIAIQEIGGISLLIRSYDYDITKEDDALEKLADCKKAVESLFFDLNQSLDDSVYSNDDFRALSA